MKSVDTVTLAVCRILARGGVTRDRSFCCAFSPFLTVFNVSPHPPTFFVALTLFITILSGFMWFCFSDYTVPLGFSYPFNSIVKEEK